MSNFRGKLSCSEFVFRINILVTRGRTPLGQHQESRPLARSNNSLRASSPFGSHARFILGEIYLGLARDLGASRERIGAGAR